MEATPENFNKVLGNIKIPPCPALLQEVMKTARQPNTDVERIAASVKRDAAMTAALLKLANSPLSGIRGKITSVSQAISFLGLKTTINLLTNAALSQSMGGDSEKFTKFWERSAVSAAVAARLARKLPDVSQDDAYAATLFHDCGIPVLMQHFPTYRETVMAESNEGKDIHEVENEHFSTTHAIVGNMLARSWYLPQHICQAILHHHDDTIFSSISENVSRLIGIVYMAELIVDEHLCQKNPEWEHVESDVLACLELTEQEFWELKDDMLGFLNGE
ncbi:MAG TPA: HDOD domain-containing protein [Gallionella sp.]|nr:HDOD domain-containing protein [Gallionella sp.]